MAAVLESRLVEVAQRIGDAAVAAGVRIATVETTAGGLLAAHLLAVPGASRWFDRGYVAYSLRAKLDDLGVSESVLREHGAVSTEAVLAMARGARARSGVDLVVAESGIAGPQTGRRSPKPVGTVAIALSAPNAEQAEEIRLDGSRSEIMLGIAAACLERLLHALEGLARA